MTFCGILAKLEILLLALRVANLVNFSSFFFSLLLLPPYEDSCCGSYLSTRS